MAARLLCLIAFVAILSQFIKTLLGLGGLPNPVPLLRDGLLVTLALVGLSRVDIFNQRGFFLSILLLFFVLLANAAIGGLEDRHFAGLYYARLYALPLLSAVAVNGLLRQADTEQLRGLVHQVFWTGAIVLIGAIGIFLSVEFNPALLHSLMGGDNTGELATAWYIAGGTWLRMGLPATSPNALGLMTAMFLLFILSARLDGRYLQVSKGAYVAVVCAAVIVMALTFSRSAWLAFFMGGTALFFLCRREWGIGSAAGLLKLGGGLAILSFAVVVGLIWLDDYSGGFIGRWMALNTSGTDPSMVGHGESFLHAYNALEDYFWVGYPKGSVGARALLFGLTVNNAENSILSVFFDMGVPIGLAFLALVTAVLRCLWVHKAQWGLLLAFTTSSMFLPYVFEPDMIGFFLVLFALTGRLMQKDARSVESVQATRPVPKSAWRSMPAGRRSPMVFQPTRPL
ncbi:MAG: hypothetical protein RLZZ618_1807 [Pseudomonadota bacterium]|jgi:hypothetical protein